MTEWEWERRMERYRTWSDRERKGKEGGEGRRGETNDLAWRDSSQSIIFKQKQCCPREHLRSAYLIKSPSLHIYGHPPSNINLLGWDRPWRVKGGLQMGTLTAYSQCMWMFCQLCYRLVCKWVLRWMSRDYCDSIICCFGLFLVYVFMNSL